MHYANTCTQAIFLEFHKFFVSPLVREFAENKELQIPKFDKNGSKIISDNEKAWSQFNELAWKLLETISKDHQKLSNKLGFPKQSTRY